MMKRYLLIGALALLAVGCCCGQRCPHGKRCLCIKAKDRYIRSYCAPRCCSCPECCEQKGYPEAGCCYE